MKNKRILTTCVSFSLLACAFLHFSSYRTSVKAEPPKEEQIDFGGLENKEVLRPKDLGDPIKEALESVKQEEIKNIPSKSKDKLEELKEHIDKLQPININLDVDLGEFEAIKSEDKQYNVKPIEDYKFGQIMESVISNEPVDLNLEMDRPSVVGIEWSEWKKEQYTISANLEDIIVRFKNTAKELPEGKPRYFQVMLNFEGNDVLGEQVSVDRTTNADNITKSEDSVIIKHSMPKVQAEAGGVILKLNRDKQSRFFLRGRDDSGVVVILPAVKQRKLRAVMLCPRDYDIWQLKGGYAYLKNTGYELVGMDAKVKAEAKAGVTTGFGDGYAAVQIVTTPNLLPSKFSIDEARLQRPFVSLIYKPWGQKPLLEENNQSISAGVLVKTTHQNSFNHKTVQIGEVRTTVKRVELKDSIYLTFQGTPFKIQEGDCYTVIREDFLGKRFIQERIKD